MIFSLVVGGFACTIFLKKSHRKKSGLVRSGEPLDMTTKFYPSIGKLVMQKSLKDSAPMSWRTILLELYTLSCMQINMF